MPTGSKDQIINNLPINETFTLDAALNDLAWEQAQEEERVAMRAAERADEEDVQFLEQLAGNPAVLELAD